MPHRRFSCKHGTLRHKALSGTRQAQSRARQASRFRCRLSQISTRRQWIAFARLLGPHLTRSRRALLPGRSPPRLLTAAARGGLRPPLQGDRGRPPDPTARPLHLRCSTASTGPIFYIDLLSAFGAHPTRLRSPRRPPVPNHPTVRTGPDGALTAPFSCPERRAKFLGRLLRVRPRHPSCPTRAVRLPARFDGALSLLRAS
jgi:hypothetical protein